MKGIELPINTIVIVVICLTVLIAIITLFFRVWNPGKSSITLEVARSNACQMIVSVGCNLPVYSISIRDFDANKNEKLNDLGTINGNEPWNTNTNCGPSATSGDNLATLCLCYRNLQNDTDCKKNLCDCNI